MDELIQEDQLRRAHLEELCSCPDCNSRALLPFPLLMFLCPNVEYRKITCRNCQKDWADHKDKTCEEIETKDETTLRKEYEEKMTAAKIRTCAGCRAELTKEDGCNLIKCRCGKTMCYICRHDNVGYGHFCRHFREPGCSCATCDACSPFTKTEEDENRAITELRAKANENKVGMGFNEKLTFGVHGPTSKTNQSQIMYYIHVLERPL